MAEDTGTGKRAPGKLGKTITTVGVAMLAISILLAIGGVEGATMHNILQIGGIGIAVIGWILWRVVKV